MSITMRLGNFPDLSLQKLMHFRLTHTSIYFKCNTSLISTCVYLTMPSNGFFFNLLLVSDCIKLQCLFAVGIVQVTTALIVLLAKIRSAQGRF